jgi:hypothetical protein
VTLDGTATRFLSKKWPRRWCRIPGPDQLNCLLITGNHRLSAQPMLLATIPKSTRLLSLINRYHFRARIQSLPASRQPEHSRISVSIHQRFQLFHSTLSRQTMSSPTNFYDLKADLPNGNSYNFDELKGKVVLIVNVASQWCVRCFDRVCGNPETARDSLNCMELQWIHFSVQRCGESVVYWLPFGGN